MAIKGYVPAVKYGNLVASDEIDSGAISGSLLATGTPFMIAKDSNGTTDVSVFGTSGLPYAITITGVFLVSQDTTATNITVENPASTIVCTIAKGTSAGVTVGATTLSNTSVAANTNVIIDGSGAGIARVFITYVKA